MSRSLLISLLGILLFSAAVFGQSTEVKRTQDPSFSPDGKLIVFSATITKVSDDLSKGIAIMNVDGTQVRTVTPNTPGVFDELPSMSLDGKRITFLRRTSTTRSDVFVVNTDGTGLMQLTTSPEPELRPEFDHDGSGVVFARNLSPNVSFRFGSLHMVDIASKKERQIIGKEYQVSHAVPAPRGLFFASMAKLDATGKPLSVIGNGQMITLITPTGEVSPESPIRLPDGTLTISRIQFVTSGKEFVMYAQSGGWFGNAFVITPKGVEKFEDIDYSLSPDGTKLVKWGGGSSVYVKALRAERGVLVGEK